MTACILIMTTLVLEGNQPVTELGLMKHPTHNLFESIPELISDTKG